MITIDNILVQNTMPNIKKICWIVQAQEETYPDTQKTTLKNFLLLLCYIFNRIHYVQIIILHQVT